jgi:hypothetical protein
MAIIAVYPGYANLAVAIVDVTTHQILASGTYVVKNIGDNDARVVRRIHDALAQTWAASPIPPVRGVVETQCMGQVLRGVEYAALSWMLTLQIPCVAAHPSSIKSTVAGLGFNGHRQNKLDAQAVAQSWGYPKTNNHVADCVVMAEWANVQPESMFIGDSFLN